MGKTNRQKAFDIYKEHGGKIALTEIARMLGSPEGTVRGWKSKDKWDEKLNGTFQKEKKNAPTEKAERSKKNKGGAPKGNKNAKGNSGGAPSNNKNAVSHGLFAKWLPPDTLEILTGVAQLGPADMLWQNIMIQYTAVLRSQKIMYVQDHYDKTEETIGMSQGLDSQSMTKMVQMAWDKQDQFLSAQSRAMSVLNNMIKQFILIADEKDERRLKLQQIEAGIELTKAQTAKIENTLDDGQTTEDKLKDYFDKLGGAVDELD